MIVNIPNWVEILFLLTCIYTIIIFHISNGKPYIITLVIILWSGLQSILAYREFYLVTDTVPPRFILVLLPITAAVLWMTLSQKGKELISKRDLKYSTVLHLVRFPVEITLWQLYLYQMIPELMTFEGRNFDIIIGILTPIVGFLYIKNKMSLKVLRVWNIIGLILVSFIMVNGILSAELPIQQFAFDQSSRGLNYFPFILLPAVVVPLVIYTHITDIIKINRLLKSAA